MNGVDVKPSAAARCDYGLKCRLYQTTDGLQGTPPEHWVVTALRREAGETDGEEHRAV